MNRGAAAACYVPVPALAWLVARSAPRDRLVRHHARQGGLLTVVAWLLLLALGFLMEIPQLQAPMTWISGLVVGLALLGILVGSVSAARGRFARLRPLWDVLAAFSGPRSPRTPTSATRP